MCGTYVCKVWKWLFDHFLYWLMWDYGFMTEPAIILGESKVSNSEALVHKRYYHKLACSLDPPNGAFQAHQLYWLDIVGEWVISMPDNAPPSASCTTPATPLPFLGSVTFTGGDGWCWGQTKTTAIVNSFRVYLPGWVCLSNYYSSWRKISSIDLMYRN